MEHITSDVEIFRALIEREVGNTYETIRELILSSIPSQYKSFTSPFIKQYEPVIIEKLQEKTDMIINMSSVGEGITLEQMMANANEIVNSVLANFISSKFNLPNDIVKVSLDTFLDSKL